MHWGLMDQMSLIVEIALRQDIHPVDVSRVIAGLTLDDPQGMLESGDAGKLLGAETN
ncbi:MAG: hypothetical protein O3A63_20715 [Proteobacteria bacterium]|nr:hypothetical protein [Pseudomonadota bacterium]